MLTGLVEPKLRVGGYWTPVGAEEIEAVSAMLPVKPPEGVIVMVDLFPAVAPDAMDINDDKQYRSVIKLYFFLVARACFHLFPYSTGN